MKPRPTRRAPTLSNESPWRVRGTNYVGGYDFENRFRRREDAERSVELLGDARDDALEQLVRVAMERFGTKRLTLLGPRDVQERLSRIATERGLEIEERER
jgi:hypothetical protein